MKRLISAAGIAGMAFLLSSCFVLQGFSVLANKIAPGGTTKAQLTLHPNTTSPDSGYQFVVIGVDDSNELKALKATWGTNGKFGGPFAMSVSAPLPQAITDSGAFFCKSNGFDYTTLTGLTLKGYITPNKVKDKGLVNTKAILQVGIKAVGDSTSGEKAVIAITGKWQDSGDGIVNSDDTFYCTGIAQVSVYVT
jgi:hypothetical protein